MTIQPYTPFLLRDPWSADFGTPQATQLTAGAGLSITPGYQSTPTIINLTEAPEGLIGSFLLSSGAYAGPSGGYEKVTYSMSTALKNFLATSPAGAASVVLPLSLFITSPSTPIKIAIGTNLYTPPFSGGSDYSVSINVVNNYALNTSGTTLYVPLSAISGSPTQLIIFVQNATSMPYVGSFSSSTVLSTTGTGVQ